MPSLIGWVVLVQLVNHSKQQFPQLYNGKENHSNSGFLKRLNDAHALPDS